MTRKRCKKLLMGEVGYSRNHAEKVLRENRKYTNFGLYIYERDACIHDMKRFIRQIVNENLEKDPNDSSTRLLSEMFMLLDVLHGSYGEI